jgi:hypothetical protein
MRWLPPHGRKMVSSCRTMFVALKERALSRAALAPAYHQRVRAPTGTLAARTARGTTSPATRCAPATPPASVTGRRIWLAPNPR